MCVVASASDPSELGGGASVTLCISKAEVSKIVALAAIWEDSRSKRLWVSREVLCATGAWRRMCERSGPDWPKPACLHPGPRRRFFLASRRRFRVFRPMDAPIGWAHALADALGVLGRIADGDLETSMIFSGEGAGGVPVTAGIRQGPLSGAADVVLGREVGDLLVRRRCGDCTVEVLATAPGAPLCPSAVAQRSGHAPAGAQVRVAFYHLMRISRQSQACAYQVWLLPCGQGRDFCQVPRCAIWGRLRRHSGTKSSCHREKVGGEARFGSPRRDAGPRRAHLRFAQLDRAQRTRHAAQCLARAPWTAMLHMAMQRAAGQGLDVEWRDHEAETLQRQSDSTLDPVVPRLPIDAQRGISMRPRSNRCALGTCAGAHLALARGVRERYLVVGGRRTSLSRRSGDVGMTFRRCCCAAPAGGVWSTRRRCLERGWRGCARTFGRAWRASRAPLCMHGAQHGGVAWCPRHVASVAGSRRATIQTSTPSSAVARLPVPSRFAFRPELATAVEEAAHDCALCQPALRGKRATQAAVYMGATPWAYNKSRNGVNVLAFCLLIARVKETRRRHALIRVAHEGPPPWRSTLAPECGGCNVGASTRCHVEDPAPFGSSVPPQSCCQHPALDRTSVLLVCCKKN